MIAGIEESSSSAGIDLGAAEELAAEPALEEAPAEEVVEEPAAEEAVEEAPAEEVAEEPAAEKLRLKKQKSRC